MLSTPANCINPLLIGERISINYAPNYLIIFLLVLGRFETLRGLVGVLKVCFAYLDKNIKSTNAKTINAITKISVT
jgi:hypothetical protein